jgi:formyl-CoA transferase
MSEPAASPAAGPLDGLLVVDLGQIYNGPYASLLLALGGARVIKVEPPRGDLLRLRGGRVRGALYPFCALNSSKEGIVLDLKSEAGLGLLGELVERADVLVENFRPGVMERLGMGPPAAPPAPATAAPAPTATTRRWTSPCRRCRG